MLCRTDLLALSATEEGLVCANVERGTFAPRGIAVIGRLTRVLDIDVTIKPL